MGLEIEVEVETEKKVSLSVFYERRREDGTYTPVTPLSTTVPGRVFPFLSACWEFVAKNLLIQVSSTDP